VPPANVHDQEVGPPVERSVNATVPPTLTVVGVAEKSAVTVAAPLLGALPGQVVAPVEVGSSHGLSRTLLAVPLDSQ